jgi:predicted lipid-binding transport protein (Tim44 family)
MGKWLIGICIALVAGVMAASDAEARRLGGGRSVGAQRSVTAPPAAAPAKPAQPQQAAPQQAQPSRWGMLGGILGGLALGGMLGYLFGGNGIMGLLVLALLALAVVFMVRAATRRRGEQHPVQLAGMGGETVQAPAPLQASAGKAVPVSNGRVPAGFDTPGFLRAAKMNFIKLQMANDSGRLDEIREFTTPELFDELRTDIQSGNATDVVSLNADLLEVANEKNSFWASVRFSGLVRETPNAEPVGFEEVWNLVKPADGSTGWLLAGIQQMH